MRTDLLLDSNIIIDHLNGKQQATNFLSDLPVLRVSSATVFEVLAGCVDERIAQLDAARDLFSVCDIIDFSPSEAESAAQMFRDSQSRKKILDYFIAATAENHHLEVATRNPKDFKKTETLVPYILD